MPSAFDVMARVDRREAEQFEARLKRVLSESLPVEVPYWERPPTDDDYCLWSDLRKEHCAGKCCLNHYLDPDLLEASKP